MDFYGSVKFVGQGVSELKNATFERLSSTQISALTGAELYVGRIAYDTTLGQYRSYNGTQWITMIAASQAELDALESSVGTFVAGDGTFNASTADAALSTVTSPTSISNIFQQMDAYAMAHNAITEMTDVSITSLAAGDMLVWNGTAWVDQSRTEAGFAASGSNSDITALNTLSGNVTFTGTGNRIKGDFSNMSSAARLMFQSSSNNGVTYVGAIPNGASSDCGFWSFNSNDPDNSAYITTGINSTGAYITTYKNGTGSAAPLTFNVNGAERMRINIDGSTQFSGTGSRIKGDFSNATVANRVMFQTTQTNQGTIVGAIPDGTAFTAGWTAYNNSTPTNSSLIEMKVSNTTALLNVDVAGTGTQLPLSVRIGNTERLGISTSGVIKMSGTLDMNSNIISNVTNPSNPQDAATKNYVDSLVQGLDSKASVRVATTTNGTLATSFANAQVVDGVTLATGNRILIKNQTTQTENGIYTVNASGAPTRATDANVWSNLVSAYTFVEEGTTNADTGWVCTVDSTGTIGTNNITFVQFSSAGVITAGSGLTKTGNTLSVNVDASTTDIVGNNIIVKDLGITAAKIANATITNTQISATAAIGRSKLAAGTASTVVVNDGTGVLSDSTVSTTELGYVSGVTSAIQTQLNGKAASGSNSDITALNTLSGNVTFTGTGNRIKGDFSNATVLNRTLFQSSTTNGQTSICAIPNGTGTSSTFTLYNSTDPTNSSTFDINLSSTTAYIASDKTGTGTVKPMVLYVGGDRITIDSSGNTTFNGTAARIRGDFSNATIANRLAFQNSTTNSETAVNTLPNGTSTQAGWSAFNSSSATNCGYIYSFINSTGAYISSDKIGTGSYLPLVITVGGAERMRIDTNGNVGIGMTPTSNTRLILKGASTTSSDSALVVQNSSGANLFIVRDDGVIGTGTGPALAPYNNVTAAAANMVIDSSGVFLRSTSSIRYKHDVKDAWYGLTDVMKLRPVTYKGNNDGDKVFGGLIAEEVHEAGLTEFVQYNDEGQPDALSYSNMVSLCIAAIKELNTTVESLKAELNDLKSKNNLI